MERLLRVGGKAFDFSSNKIVIFTVTSANASSTATYTVNAIKDPNSPTMMSNFSLSDTNGNKALGTPQCTVQACTIAVLMPFGTISTLQLIPTFTTPGTVTDKNGNPVLSGGVSLIDFSNSVINPVTFTVTATDGTQLQATYKITVTIAPNPSTDTTLNNFSLPGMVSVTQPQQPCTTCTIAVFMPLGTNPALQLIPTFAAAGGVTDKNGKAVFSGITPIDFSNSVINPVVLTVTASGGNQATYSITVTINKNLVNAIIAVNGISTKGLDIRQGATGKVDLIFSGIATTITVKLPVDGTAKNWALQNNGKCSINVINGTCAVSLTYTATTITTVGPSRPTLSVAFNYKDNVTSNKSIDGLPIIIPYQVESSAGGPISIMNTLGGGYSKLAHGQIRNLTLYENKELTQSILYVNSNSGKGELGAPLTYLSYVDIGKSLTSSTDFTSVPSYCDNCREGVKGFYTPIAFEYSNPTIDSNKKMVHIKLTQSEGINEGDIYDSVYHVFSTEMSGAGGTPPININQYAYMSAIYTDYANYITPQDLSGVQSSPLIDFPGNTYITGVANDSHSMPNITPFEYMWSYDPNNNVRWVHFLYSATASTPSAPIQPPSRPVPSTTGTKNADGIMTPSTIYFKSNEPVAQIFALNNKDGNSLQNFPITIPSSTKSNVVVQGDYLFVGDDNGNIQFFNSTTGYKYNATQFNPTTDKSGIDNLIINSSFDVNKNLVYTLYALADNGVYSYDITSIISSPPATPGPALGAIAFKSFSFTKTSSTSLTAQCIVLSPAQNIIYVSSGAVIHAINMMSTDGKTLPELWNSSSVLLNVTNLNITALALSSDGTTIYAGGVGFVYPVSTILPNFNNFFGPLPN